MSIQTSREHIREQFNAGVLSQHPDEAVMEILRANYEENLGDFLQGAWKYIDPNTFIPGWHLDAIGEHLAAVANGEIRRLVINVPPR